MTQEITTNGTKDAQGHDGLRTFAFLVRPSSVGTEEFALNLILYQTGS